MSELIGKIYGLYAREPITLMIDNARYQRNAEMQRLTQELRVELLFLPPYSPNLNLIERLWKLVKSKCLRNRYFPEFVGFRSAIDDFLDSLKTGEQKGDAKEPHHRKLSTH